MIEVRKTRVFFCAGKSQKMKGDFAEMNVSLPEAAFVGALYNI